MRTLNTIRSDGVSRRSAYSFEMDIEHCDTNYDLLLLGAMLEDFGSLRARCWICVKCIAAHVEVVRC